MLPTIAIAALFATEADAATLQLSYAEALQRASERNPSVRNAELDLNVADGAILAARATFEPRFNLSGTTFSSTNEGQFQFGDYNSETTGTNVSAGVEQPIATGTAFGVTYDANQQDTTFTVKNLEQEFGEPAWDTKLAFTLSQSLLQGHRLAYNLQVVRGARRARSVAEAQRQAIRESALADTARAYWGLYYAEQVEKIALQGMDAAVGQQRVIHALVTEGRLAGVEGTRMDAAVGQAERAVMEASAAADAATNALLLLLGEMPGQSIELTSPPVGPPDLTLDAEAVVEAVLSGNPDLLALKIAADAKQASVRDSRHALLPQLDATASYGLRGYDKTFSGSTAELGAATLPEWTLGARLDLPLFNFADRGALQQRIGEAARAEIDVHAMEGVLSQQARSQVRTIASARRVVELARIGVSLAEQTLAAEKANVLEGRVIQTQLTTALKDLDTARADAEKALTDYQIAVVELERLKGSL